MLGTLDICLQWVIQVILKGQLVRTSTWLISSSTTARYIISNWKMGAGDHPWLYQWKRVHDPYFSTKTRSLISRDNDALIYLPACCLVHSGGAHSGAAARRDTVQYGVMHPAQQGTVKKKKKIMFLFYEISENQSCIFLTTVLRGNPSNIWTWDLLLEVDLFLNFQIIWQMLCKLAIMEQSPLPSCFSQNWRNFVQRL